MRSTELTGIDDARKDPLNAPANNTEQRARFEAFAVLQGMHGILQGADENGFYKSNTVNFAHKVWLAAETPLLERIAELEGQLEERDAEKFFPVLGGGKIPFAMIEFHERRAQANHYQTLERLAQRGGLCPSELIAVFEDRPWKKMEAREAADKLSELVSNYKSKRQLANREPFVVKLPKEWNCTKDDPAEYQAMVLGGQQMMSDIKAAITAAGGRCV